MPQASPPYDRAIALACTMHTLRGRWIYVTCRCGARQSRPVRMMLTEQPTTAARTLADVVVHLRCHSCSGRPVSVHLAETALGPGPVSGRVEAGWSVLLHGAVPQVPR